jgi:hypothetical protein
MNITQLLRFRKPVEQWDNPDSHFEDETAGRFFPEDLYEVVQWKKDGDSNGKQYIRTGANPGYQMGIRNSDVNFWVEYKYRENRAGSELTDIFNAEQLKTFKSIKNSFLFLCTKGQEEQEYYFIPFNHISEAHLNFSFIEPYKLNYGIGVRPGMIQQYLRLDTANLVLKF